MNKKAIFIMALFLFFLPLESLAFEFKEFEWGEDERSVKETVRNDRKKRMLISDFVWQIRYEERLFGEPAEVELVFTRGSKKLAAINVVWNTVDVGEEARKSLNDRLGRPEKVNTFAKHYEWKGPYTDERIILDYFEEKTTVSFRGGKYYREFLKEGKY